MDQTFDLWVFRFHGRARHSFRLDANFLRGGFGAALRGLDRAAYDRYFAPRQQQGPSGFRNAPRPFVFRVRDRDVAGGEVFDFAFHWFQSDRPVDAVVQACRQFASELDSERLSLPFGAAREVPRIRVRFLTATGLKSATNDHGDAGEPSFHVLFARARDRISTLRALYQGGPLDVDFKAMGDRARLVKMTRCEIQHAAAERTSRATGQTHSLGGFVGVAEYEGDLEEFLPYLEIARWTGVGRQTVWGKGEIVCETF